MVDVPADSTFTRSWVLEDGGLDMGACMVNPRQPKKRRNGYFLCDYFVAPAGPWQFSVNDKGEELETRGAIFKRQIEAQAQQAAGGQASTAAPPESPEVAEARSRHLALARAAAAAKRAKTTSGSFQPAEFTSPATPTVSHASGASTVSPATTASGSGASTTTAARTLFAEL